MWKSLKPAIICLLCALPATAPGAAIHVGLRSYWALDGNGNDTAALLTGNTSTVADNLTVAGTGASIVGTGGRFGGSGSFQRATGTDGRLAATNSSDLNRGGADLTMSLWVQFEDQDTSWQAILSKGEGSNYRLAAGSGGGNNAAYAGGAGDIIGTSDIQNGGWHHIVATTTNGGGVFVYVNGVLEVSNAGANANIASTTTELWVGNNPNAASRMWDGRIDDIGLWDRALSLSEVQEIYNAGISGNSLAAIPEPSAALLAGLGSLLLLRRRR